MIRDVACWEAFERDLISKQKLDYAENLRLVDGMYDLGASSASSRPRTPWTALRRPSVWREKPSTVFEELLKRLAVALEGAALPYMVFGGQAVLLYGEPRLTRDIDITVGVDPSQPVPVLRVIEELQLRNSSSTTLTDF